MVAKAGAPYRSANAGELSPDASGRADIKQFYSAGIAYKNIEPVPLSGFRLMAGSLDLGPVRGTVEALEKSAITVSAGPHTGTQTIYQATVGGAVVAIDCAALMASTGLHEVYAETRRGGLWVKLGASLEAGTAAQSLTFAAAPGAGRVANSIRVVAVFSVSASITLGTVSVLAETAGQAEPRYAAMRHDDGSRYFMALGPKLLDIWKDDQFVAAVYLPDVDGSLVWRSNFYAENATIGIAHRNLETQRVRRGGNDRQWVRDLWPYDGLPKVDLGAVYTKTDDVWIVSVNWTGNSIYAYVTITVNDETTPAISFVDAASLPVFVGSGGVDLVVTAALLKTAIEALPSLGPTVTVAIADKPGNWYEINITFGGDLSGAEYGLVAAISNTADAAALASHLQIGETDYEPLFSNLRGWPGAFGFAQERLLYGDIKVEPSAIAMSQAGEYFRLDIEIAGPAAPRLDRLRGGQTSERILAFAESVYLLAFSDRSVYFASNRTINKTDPLNFVRVADIGIALNCDPVLAENKIYFIGANPDDRGAGGNQLLSLSYSEIETSFQPVPEHIFATHLVKNVIRLETQKPSRTADAAKLWLLRQDGRLVAACVIESQEIVGFCEWVPAASGEVVEILIDAANQVRMAVRRGAKLRHERQDDGTLLQAAIDATADLAGVVSGLELHEGRAVWVEQGGYVEGPFDVVGGAISLDATYMGPLRVGPWQCPRWEGMPRTFINRNDEIVKRPGRIHSVTLEVIATTSLAVGANSQPPETVTLSKTTTVLDRAPKPFTGQARRSGMLGSITGTTLVVTQQRPGRLQVRDMVIEEKL